MFEFATEDVLTMLVFSEVDMVFMIADGSMITLANVEDFKK